MDRPKWHSKLIHMAVVLSVLVSLVGAVLVPTAAPVAAAPGATLGVTVDTDADEYCVCNDILVTANISNSGPDACNVSANLTWSPWSGAHLVSGTNPRVLDDMAAYSWSLETWTMHCDAPGALNITVNATGTIWTFTAIIGATNATDTKEVMQFGHAELTTLVFTPQEGDIFTQGDTFPLLFQITNNGTAPALHVNGTIFPSANVAILGLPCGNAYTTGTLPRLDPGESWNWTVMMTCCGCDVPPLVSSIHVVPNGDGFCTGKEIQDKYTYSDIVRIDQVYNVSCNATPNPTKVGHNVTFTAWFGACAESPMSWNWSFGDGEWEAGSGHDPDYPLVVSHGYDSSGNYTAVVNVTDGVGVNGTCQVTVEVFPPLTARCMVEPFDFTKLCHNLTFNGTAVGGFPADMCTYNWTWDFGDGTTINGTGYSSGPQVHSYCNTTGNFTAVFTIGDDCLNNTANCSMNITVFPPLQAWCNVTSNVTKVGHNVTFCGEAIDGIPNNYSKGLCTYNWTWDFGDGTSESGTGDSTCISHGYNESGNYTAVFTIQDNCWNNTATCNETVEVFPRLEVICEGEDSTVCNAVNFTAVRVGGIPTANYTWTWDFGDPFDDTPGTTQNATHAYMCTGNYTATVTVCDDLLEQNCANCSVNVTITIEPPELHFPINGSTVTVGCNNTICFEWDDIGCCNYTLQIWQKEADGQKIWNLNTGKDNFACVQLWDNPVGWRWQVIAVDACGEWVQSETWFFNTERDCMYPAVVVTRPNGGETFECGTNETITWGASEYGTVGGGLGLDQSDLTIDIYYSTNGGATWSTVVEGWWNSGAYPWTVPDVNSNQCVVVVVATDAQGNPGNDVSNGVFTIECAPPPTTCTTLYTGWNLYATPLIPDNTSTSNVIAGINTSVSIIWSYNASSGSWLWYVPGNPASTLMTMEDGVGYWVYMNVTDTLCIVGQPLPDPPSLPPTYNVVPGWNLIGFKSTIPLHHSDYLFNLWSGGHPNYSVLWAYDGSVPEYVNLFPMEQNGGMMEPGHGFWLWATAAGIIVPIS